MKKLLSIALLVTMLVACSNAPAENATPDATGETSETAQEVAPEALETEAELGITHPLHFASEMKIVSDKSYFDIEVYEMPTKIDGKDVVPGEPLTKTRIITYLLQPYDEHDSSAPQYDGAMSVGYYDLVRGEYVEMAGEDVLSQSGNPVRVSIFPVDEEYCVYGEETDDQSTYYLYRIADGTKK